MVFNSGPGSSVSTPGPSGTIRNVTLLIRSHTVFIRAGPGQSVLIHVATVSLPCLSGAIRVQSVFIRAWSGMNRVWSGVIRVQHDMPDRPGSTRCHYGPSRNHYGPSRSQHGRYTDRPGLPRIEKSSRTVPDDHGNFKQFKTAGAVSRIIPDYPGPSRIVPDCPG